MNIQNNFLRRNTAVANYMVKTYRDSYLYNQNNGAENLMKKHEKILINYIMKADRIDKKSEEFSGVVEDIKRQQTTSVLYTILMMDNVHLCVNQTELSPAFKVFEAYDIRSEERKPAIFIDCTKMVIKKNGYYVCKNIGKLVTYLMNALVYLTYRKDVAKLMSNATITIAGTECYVSMFNYILDYLRIIGYSANKDKISYLIGLFYLNNLMGKDLDNYTKGIAAKVAKISTANINAYDLYIEDGCFDNIDSFVTFLSTVFKLKGFTTEVFITKWIYLFGNGTQYGTELFTSFANILVDTFCGAYVINQKQVERCCGTSMVKFCNALITAAVDLFDNRMYMERTELDKLQPRSKTTQDFARSMRNRNLTPKDIALVKENFESVEAIEGKIKDNIEHYSTCFDGSEKLSSVFEAATNMAMFALDSHCADNTPYENGVLTTVIKNGKKFYNETAKARFYNALTNKCNAYREAMNKAEDKETADRYAKGLSEAINCKNIVY